MCLQAVTKYTVATGALSGKHPTASPIRQEINIRDAFVAGPGCILIAADYSQIELRLLAHLSGDPKLILVLRQAGVSGDAFALIANMWLRKPHGTGKYSGKLQPGYKHIDEIQLDGVRISCALLHNSISLQQSAIYIYLPVM